ncbi:AT-rich interactive domain-containing protein [Quillaja saponaria]|uniref:AT-rich interactive domain-containing protein n=1 Tax=Quillaja saponaria TaxID=32244 RepID=A0AAD7LZ95_QUISA|nr:AT-rich interactive domain-containing protein [Quillaja saponaria]KAJ7967015.1 AT-rich interactive domain-containing protein [Quillaja saponaria]
MEDTGKEGHISHGDSDIEFVGSTVGQQESTPTKPTPTDPKPKPKPEVDGVPTEPESGQSPRQDTRDDKCPKLPTDACADEDQVMVDETETETVDKSAPVPDDAKIDDASLKKLPEQKSIGDITPPTDKHLKDVKSISRYGASTLKAKDKNNVGEANNTLVDTQMAQYDESGTVEERAAFMRQLESFYRERAMEFKAPKFYGEPLNCLKLWRAVTRLGGYDVVTASKLWRQVGESFHPPKTCTTVSWTFRIFYEKALLEYEKHKRETGELQLPVEFFHQSSIVEKEAPGSGRARRDAAARAMQGWHAQRLLGYGEVAEPIIKDKNLNSMPRREKNLKSIGIINKQKIPTNQELAKRATNIEGDRQLVTAVADIGPPADWVKVNVRETRDCFEVYALVPGLLREEVRVQSDPAGRLVITGEPEQVDNPWGITPFKKVVSLPARIDPVQTSAVVSLHGRLFVRVPFEHGAV